MLVIHLKISFCSQDIQIFVNLSSPSFLVSHCFRGWSKKNLNIYDILQGFDNLSIQHTYVSLSYDCFHVYLGIYILFIFVYIKIYPGLTWVKQHQKWRDQKKKKKKNPLNSQFYCKRMSFKCCEVWHYKAVYQTVLQGSVSNCFVRYTALFAKKRQFFQFFCLFVCLFFVLLRSRN